MARKKRRQKRLDRTVTLIQHQWGPNALRKGQPRARRIPHIATGFPGLDKALGIGGVPRGKMTFLSGRATSGKSTLAARILAQSQARGRTVAIIDVNHTCDADYLERCGVRLRDLLVVRPEDGRQALELMLALANRSELAAILFDHWGALETDRDTQRYATTILDRLVGVLAKSGIAFLALGTPPPLWRRLSGRGGSALAHYSTLHLTLSREKWFHLGPDVRGYTATVTIEKNKLGPAGKKVPIEIHFNGTVQGKGI
jgi:recombination protein RecA